MSKTILIAEDDRSIQKMLQEILENEGFSVICEKDGDWALRTFEAKDIDFVILDILIPIINGFQVAEKLRAMPKGKDIPILMISGIYRGEKQHEQAREKYGVCEYLEKPIHTDDLLRVLQKTFGTDYPSPVATKAEQEEIDLKPSEPYVSSDGRFEKEEVEKGSEEFHPSGSFESLQVTSFAELLGRLYREKAYGALLVKRDKVKKIVYFRSGYPVFVKSNLLSECLGKLMVRERIITEQDCVESLRQMKKTKRQQGTILIEMGSISPHNLQYALELQLKLKLFDLFEWEDGEYQYSSSSSLPPTTVSLNSSAAALIYAGVRKQYRLDRLKHLLDDSLDKYVVPHANPLFRFQDMELGETEEKFVSTLTGSLTLRQILDLGMKQESIYQLVYALKAAQMFTLNDQPLDKAFEVKVSPEKQKEYEEKSGFSVPISAPSLGISEVSFETAREDRSFREQLAQQLIELKNKNYFDMLGVSKNASQDEVKGAYFALVKQYHPDRLSVTTSREIRSLAEEIFNLVTNAYTVLSNVDQREEYLQGLSQMRKQKVSPRATKVLSAESLFHQGQEALRKGDHVKAREIFKQMVALCPEESDFHAYLGWSYFQNNPKDNSNVQHAKEELNQAISLNPKDDRAYLFLGYIYKAKNQKKRAEQEFEKAVQCNPDCTEALRELRLFARQRKNK